MFSIPVQQKSGVCPSCGNIEQTSGWNDLVNKISNRLNPEDPLVKFSKPADGIKVEELLIQFQVEWQLWAVVVNQFADPNVHAAYLTHLIQNRAYPKGVQRYTEHRQAMVLLEDSRWQSEICELMLDRIQQLTEARMSVDNSSLRLGEWLMLLPLNSSSTFRIAWVSLGMIGLWTLFRIF